MDSFSDVGAPPPAKRVCLSTQTPRTIFSGLITFILAASSAATSAALFVTFDEHHAQWSEQWMARPRFGQVSLALLQISPCGPALRLLAEATTSHPSHPCSNNDASRVCFAEEKKF